MSETMAPFAKMNGAGNKIVVADMRARGDHVTAQAAIALAQNEETHFDQLMAVHAPGPIGKDAVIEIFNSDGSRAGACGNGTRCVVTRLDVPVNGKFFSFEVDGHPLKAIRGEDGMVTVNMGVPRFEWDQIPLEEEFADTTGIQLQVGPIDNPVLHTPSVVNVGNPHAVFWVEDDVNNYALDKFGPMLEHHMLFPERANISIARVAGNGSLDLRTWERGAGLTLACGSAACAAAVCAYRLKKTGRKVDVSLPGGMLHIEWREDNFILMTGPTEHEFDGFFDPATGAWERAA
ncbi:MAG: diaminopimelate epimerase [Ahrensia sp.]|nr:diaminopimelate epimerase [Ahrensia sp.]